MFVMERWSTLLYKGDQRVEGGFLALIEVGGLKVWGWGRALLKFPNTTNCYD
jgi:hypothetical protein